MTAPGEIALNAGRAGIVLMVANTGDRPVQVGSHYHFFEANPALEFDRAAARGRRLDIAAGTAVRFEPGQRREVSLIELSGARTVYGFAGRIMGPLALMLALMWPDPGAAQDDPDGCGAFDTQAGMTACAAEAYAKDDAVLNDLWPDVMAVAADYGTEDLLRDAQRKWIAYRDAACESEAAVYAGGSLEPMVRYDCLSRMTQDRIFSLELYGQ